MQDKQNSDWKSRLQDESAFAGDEILNSNAAWEALYERMHTPKR
jgi:hypothetical protein